MLKTRKMVLSAVLLFALTSAAALGWFSFHRSSEEPAKLCLAILNVTAVRFPCAWGLRIYDPKNMPSEARVELRPFAIDGRDGEGSDAEVVVWLTAQRHIYRGNIFGNFGLSKEYFDRIASTSLTVDLLAQISHPLPRSYRLTFTAEGDEWIVSTFLDSNFRPLPDGEGYGATESKWYAQFEPGDTDVPSFGMYCNFAPNCRMQLKEDDLSVSVFVSRRLVAERHRIAASVRAITRAILEGSLSPSEHRNPCVVIGVCLPDLAIAPLGQ